MAATVAATLLVGPAACAGDDDAAAPGDEVDETVATDLVADLLGEPNPATGEPVKVGLVSEGATGAVDTSDELRAGEATVEYLNEYMGGIGGRPIELVTCEMKLDPAAAANCANQMVQEGVVAVTLAQSGEAEAVWKPLNEAGIPFLVQQGFGEPLLADDRSTYVMTNPVAVFFGLPIALAEAEGAEKVAFVVIDVPQATDLVESDDGATMARAGLDYEVVRVPVGTADMTPQMQEVKESGAGVVHVLGNDAFCIAAFQGLQAVQYEGAVAGVSQCLTDATREAMGSDLEGTAVLATLASGATGDPSWELFQAVMETYGGEVRDVHGPYALGGYAAVAMLAAAVEGIEGEITAESVNAAIKSMPDTALPGGGGVMFRCGGSASADQPAVCTNQWLRSELDAEGNPTTYTVEDSTDVLD